MRIAAIKATVLLLLPSVMLAQNAVRPIPENNSFPKDSVFIVVNQFDSTDQYINAFLINTTDAIIKVSGKYNLIDFIWQANVNGVWVKLAEYRGVECGTGYGSMNIPSNSYLSQRILRSKFQGSYDSPVRLYYAVANDTFYSAPFSYSFDTNFLLTPSNQILQRITHKLRNGNLSEEERDKLQLTRIQVLIADNRILEAKALINSIKDRSSLHYDIAYHSATILSMELRDDEDNLSDDDICNRIEEITRMYTSIPKDHQRRESAQRVARAYKDYLINKCNSEED